jgi:hypothetical protein
MTSIDAEKMKAMESEIEQLKTKLSAKESTLAEFTQKAKETITKLKTKHAEEIAALKGNSPHVSDGGVDSQNIEEIIKARDDALEEIAKVKEQAKKHLLKIKAQHQDELNALRLSLQEGSDSKSDNTENSAQASNTDQEVQALREELAKVKYSVEYGIRVNNMFMNQVKADAKKFIESLKKREQDALSAASEATAKVSNLEAEQASFHSKVEELTNAVLLAEQEGAKQKDELIKVKTHPF